MAATSIQIPEPEPEQEKRKQDIHAAYDNGDNYNLTTETELQAGKTKPLGEKNCCCCDAKLWCVFIGWINVVLSFVSIAAAVADDGSLHFARILSMFVGFLLLAGVYFKAPGLLLCWLILNAAGLWVPVLEIGAILIKVNKITTVDPALFIYAAFSILFQSFCCVVVCSHRKSIISKRKRKQPINRFSLESSAGPTDRHPSGAGLDHTNDTIVQTQC